MENFLTVAGDAAEQGGLFSITQEKAIITLALVYGDCYSELRINHGGTHN